MKPVFATMMMLVSLGTPAAAEDYKALIESGHTAYQELCSKCHGVDMVNSGNGSFDLRKFPLEESVRFQNSVLHGKDAMPAWGDILLEGELDSLWAYVASRGGKDPLPEDFRLPSASGDAPDAALDTGGAEVQQQDARLETMEEGALTVCFARNGGALSGHRHDGGAGFDYRVAEAAARHMGLRLDSVWYEAEYEGDNSPMKETAALLFYPLCDLVAAHPATQDATADFTGDSATLPRWLGMPLHWDPKTRVSLGPLSVSAPYRRVETGFVLAPSAGDRDPSGFDDLAGLRLGFQTGTLAQAMVSYQAPPSVRENSVSFWPGPAFLWELEKGAADVALVEVEAYDFHMLQNPISALRLGSWRHPLGTHIGFAVSGNKPGLTLALNDSLRAVIDSGEIGQIAEEVNVHYASPQGSEMTTARLSELFGATH